MEFLPGKEGEEAGLILFLSNEFYYKLVKRRERDGDYLCMEKRAEDFFQQVCRIPVIHDKILYLAVQAERLSYTFFWGYEKTDMKEIGAASSRFLSCEVAGRSFTGTFAGMYATGNGQDCDREAFFDYFEIKPEKS